jgi:uncharacterized protein YndB with AHSA1/START domain
MKCWTGLLVALTLAHPVAAEVTSASETGFDIALSETVAASPDAVYDALRNPSKWWNPAHSWSGDAQNLWLDAQAGGCFCEKLPGEGGARGSVQHGRVVMAQPGKLLRLSAALGPLQEQAVTGTLSWALAPADGGTGVTLTYIVAGQVRGGAAALAPAVDAVLAEQLGRLKAHLETPGG